MTERTDRRLLAHPLIVKEPGCFGKATIGYGRVRFNNVSETRCPSTPPL